jgi:CubicO group peptidase (beta-lactamase class C family)
MKRIAIILVVLLAVYAVLPLYIKRGIIYNFANVSDYQLCDNRLVNAGQPQPWLESNRYNAAAPSSVLLEKIEANRTIAYLVVQNDSIIFEQYWKGYDSSSYSGSFSMAKSMISLLIGIAVAEDKINSIEDPIAAYIPEFDREGTDTITVKELLAMSGGFNWKESYWNIFGKTANSYYGDDLKRLTGNLKSKFPPGEQFRYSSCETQILGWILETVYQQPIADLFSEKIWQPIGAELPAKWSLDKADGVEKAFCCFNSNTRDFARLGKLVLQGGRWDSLQLVPEDYVKQATSPAIWLKDEHGNPVDFYGYQFWIVNHRGMEIPYFRGVLGQFIFIIPQKNAVVVRLGEYVTREREHFTPPDVFTYLDAALEILN